jgi:Ca2+-binding RTX toxin-like protein
MTTFFYGTEGNNRLAGSAVLSLTAVTMYGYGGNDYLEGWLHASLNTIIGGEGNDTLGGGGYANTLSGDAGDDYIVVGYSTGMNRLYGGTGDDFLEGGRNRFAAGELGLPVNLMDGGAGNDTMVGSNSRDTYVVNSVRDVVRETYVSFFDNEPNPRDQVKSSVSYTLGENLEDLMLTRTASVSGRGNALSNNISGNPAANVLEGMNGRDTIFGGAGDDTLIGGAGRDSLRGGDGLDVFDFNASSDSGAAPDVVADFQKGTRLEAGDKIDLSSIDADPTTLGNQAFCVHRKKCLR